MSNNQSRNRYVVNCHGESYQFAQHGFYKTNIIINLAINIVLSPSTIILNTMIIIVLYRTKQLHTPTNILLINNAISDMVMGYTILFGWTPVSIMAMENNHDCTLFVLTLLIGYLSGCTSIINVILVAIDRYIAIYRPFFYRMRIYKRNSTYVKIISSIWIFLIVIVTLSILTPKFIILVAFAFLIIPIAIIWPSYVYVSIFITVRQIRKCVNSTIRGHKIKDKDLQLVKTTFTMISAVFICYGLHGALLTIWIFKKDMYTDDLYAASFWGYTLMLTKSIINPVLFCLTISDIRVAVQRFFQKKNKYQHCEFKRSVNTQQAETEM